MENLVYLWEKYNEYSNKLSEKLGKTKNIVGEYGEYLAYQYIGGQLLPNSTPHADIEAKNGDLYQVKSRMSAKSTTQLGIIRSWEFNFLFVILFNENGLIINSLISPVSIAREYAKYNKHQNGWVITTNKKFLSDSRNIDITDKIKTSFKESL